jgi:toxin YoeB
MKTEFASQALDDLFHWAEHDPKMLARIFKLIADILRHPFTGIGKPEALRHSKDGAWSRRIDQEHRLIYRVTGKGSNQILQIGQCRSHYT